MQHTPVKPSFIVSRQNSVWASLLETGDESLEAIQSESDELRAAEGLQAAAVLCVVLLDQVINAYCGVAVCHIKATS